MGVDWEPPDRLPEKLWVEEGLWVERTSYLDSFLWIYLLRVFGYCDVAYSFLFSTEAFVMSKDRCGLIRNSGYYVSHSLSSLSCC